LSLLEFSFTRGTLKGIISPGALGLIEGFSVGTLGGNPVILAGVNCDIDSLDIWEVTSLVPDFGLVIDSDLTAEGVFKYWISS